MISKEEVEHIAKLARLELTEEEVKKMQKDLSSIFDYFTLLKKVPKPAKILKQNLSEGSQHLRKDEAKARDASSVEKLIAASPDKKDDYIKVKAIF